MWELLPVSTSQALTANQVGGGVRSKTWKGYGSPTSSLLKHAHPVRAS